MTASTVSHSASQPRFPRWLVRVLSAAPDFGISGVFAITWFAPYTFGDQMVPRLVLTMLLEFIVLHSGGFLSMAVIAPAKKTQKIGAVIGLGLFYSMFAGAFGAAFHTWWPFISFWTLLLNRMVAIIIGDIPPERETGFVMAGWAYGVVAYLGFVALTSIAPMPHFGITPAVLHAEPMSGGGLWIDEPWRVLAFGTLYFAMIGVGELFGIGIPPAPKPNENPLWNNGS